MKKFNIFYPEETVQPRIKQIKIDLIKCGTMTESENGEFIFELPYLLPNVRFVAKPEEGCL